MGRSEGEACSALANPRFKRNFRKNAALQRKRKNRKLLAGNTRKRKTGFSHTVIVDCGGDC